MKVLTIEGGVPTISENFEELFQALSARGAIITNLTDETITVKENDKASDIEVHILNNEGLCSKFKQDISDYRDGLRVSMKALRKQGLVTNEALEKLTLQFEFVNEGAEKKAKPAAKKAEEKPKAA